MAPSGDAEIIKERIDLVDFINGFVPLKKAGRNFVGLCPFHTEKTPSFFISPERQFYHCFGCQKSGDIFTFLMEREGLTFPEALKILAERAGVNLSSQTFSPEASQKKERLLALTLLASEFYHQLLLNHKVAEKARSYLKKRGISPDSIKNFKLGYAPDSWESTGRFLLFRGYQKEELIESGFIIPKPNESMRRPGYDRFRARIMFPVWDVLSRVVGFSGRTLKDDPKIPKYLNSPESLIFQKGRLLYGLNLAKDEIRAQDQALLVEGNLDVISTFQAGIKNVVAPLGTGTTLHQTKLLKRFTQNVLIVFDNDEAGQKATLAAISLALKQDLKIFIANISQAKDPDEAVHKDVAGFKKDLKEAKGFFDYLLDFAQKRYALSEVNGKSSAAQLILPFLAQVLDEVGKDGYIKKLAQELKVEEKSLWANLEKIEIELAKQKNYEDTQEMVVAPDLPKPAAVPREERLADHFLTLLLATPESLFLSEEFKEFLFNKISSEIFPKEDQRVIFAAFIQDFIEKGKIDPGSIVQKIDESNLKKEFDLLLLKTSQIEIFNPEIFWQNLTKVKNELDLLYYKKRLRQLSSILGQAELEGADEKIADLKKQIRDLSKLTTTL